MPALSVQNLTKIFFTERSKPQIAVSDISFDVDQGQVVGILGPNGAGKTTTLNMLLSVLTPTTGTISYFGKNLATHRQEILQHVGYASTYERMPNRLTVYENLMVFAKLYTIPSNQIKERIQKFLRFFDIWHIRDQEQMTLSAGQYARVALAKAFLINPKIALLDEPSAALDPDIALQMREFIVMQQKENGMAIILASHNMDEVAFVCDRIIVLKNGKILANDTPEHLAASVAKTRMRLTFLHDQLGMYLTLLESKNIPYLHEQNMVMIELDEHAIAEFLSMLAQQSIVYNTITIEHPTLEDYFLSVAQKNYTAQL